MCMVQCASVGPSGGALTPVTDENTKAGIAHVSDNEEYIMWSNRPHHTGHFVPIDGLMGIFEQT